MTKSALKWIGGEFKHKSEYLSRIPDYMEIHYCRDVDDYVRIMQSNESGWFRN